MKRADKESKESERGTLRRNDCCGLCMYARRGDGELPLRCWVDPPVLPDGERAPIVDGDWPPCRFYVRVTDD